MTDISFKLFKTKDFRFSLIFFLILASLAISAEEVSVEYQLKAELLERFTRFIEWPTESSASDPNSAFVIAVIGKNPFRTYLNHLENTKIKGKKVQIALISSPAETEHCQVLFISKSEEKNLVQILSRTAGKPILTVGDTDGFAQKGVLINFYQEGEYVRFEVSQQAVDRSGLKFSSRLMKLAKLVATNSK